MRDDWRPDLVERLRRTANTGGAWGYRSNGAGSAEPTALAALALAAMGQAPAHVAAALEWLARLQRHDGAVPVSPGLPAPHWPTALALLAWQRCAQQNRQTYATQVEKAIRWLAGARGEAAPAHSTVYDHDTTLIGWPWAAGCHSWLEPTGYAVLALRAANEAQHPRVREGVRLILNRALPDGGWNYGNRRVLEHVLRPFPATTGIALAALAGEPRDQRITAALEYLTGELRHVRAPLSLAWGLIGLHAWNARPPEAVDWMHTCAQRLIERTAVPHYDALLLLAGADTCPLIVAPEVPTDA